MIPMRAERANGAEPPSPPLTGEASLPTPLPPGVVAAAVSENPYQCAYCGRPSAPADTVCPHCGRSLMVARRTGPTASTSLRTAVLLTSILAMVALFEIAPPLFAWLAAQGGDPGPFRALLQAPGATLLLGRFLNWSGSIAGGLLLIAVTRCLLLIVGTVGLLRRVAWTYYLVIGVLALDALWNLYRLATGYTGPVGAAGSLALDLAGLTMLFASDRDFAVVRRRLLVQADGGLRDGPAYYQRGQDYGRRGMWALAAAHWRLAIGAQPREVQYYKDLGRAYAQLGRYDHSLSVLEEAGRLRPQDTEVGELLKEVRNRSEA
jgi:tetratricopeptide (TPR) repeat protein